jgi:putative endonuclease
VGRPRERGDPEKIWVHCMKQFYVYIVCSKRNGTLYIGITSDLNRRIYEHKNGLIKGFTKKYSVTQLVCFEIFESAVDAIRREKQLKKWTRAWKLALIEKLNPEWFDLYETSLHE